MYRLPESKSDSFEDRVKDDLLFCLKFFNDGIQIPVIDKDISKIVRLGKHSQVTDTFNRPLLLVFHSYSVKNQIMNSLFKLKSANAKYKNLIIAHDMTPKEREQCKAKVEEAKDRAAQNQSGE